MFLKGSKVVHPFYGAGTIVEIQEKSIGESAHAYYIIDTVSRPMQLMVPVNRAEDVNLRPVAPALELRNGLEICCAPPAASEISKDLRARQAKMREQLKSGAFDQIANVTRLLYFMSTRRPLGTVDRQLLEQGKDLLAGELALASDLEIDLAKQEVEDRLMAMLDALEG
jgi:CarD family transcriptional regulator